MRTVTHLSAGVFASEATPTSPRRQRLVLTMKCTTEWLEPSIWARGRAGENRAPNTKLERTRKHAGSVSPLGKAAFRDEEYPPHH